MLRTKFNVEWVNEKLDASQGSLFSEDEVCHPYNTLERVFITELQPGDVVYAAHETQHDVLQAFPSPIIIIARVDTMTFSVMQRSIPREEYPIRSIWFQVLREV